MFLRKGINNEREMAVGKYECTCLVRGLLMFGSEIENESRPQDQSCGQMPSKS